MKRRLGFVSNSSSCSFIIDKSNLNNEQIMAILNHNKAINEFESTVGYICDEGDAFELIETDEYIKGETIMDNYPMHELFKSLNISCSEFRFAEYSSEFNDFELLIKCRNKG